ncbi:Spermatosis-associated protein 4 [Hondaea fermentalgiana]|uniref:Spermatosis-associated protein 4 n=1 Tax=Hondaea fermentalgiana TaxID=2315210 RepID=A0A2R5GSF6_9STRA|nr:Spermatosis-associated protein 4 [Hondaea fermentalgiana]|eukprot:GBG31301.1 Spermatosis-associated protein 4 [Hondaea fermentalgiana]
MADPANRLPREVLRWLQGLDLSYTIKNVRRDFANGYLFAEICARYFANEVNMHNFSTGTSMTSKNDNWFLLKKLLARLGIDCSKDLVTEIVHSKSGAAVELVERLFTHLTERKVHRVAQPQKPLRVPAFARDTASNLIKRRLKEPDLIHLQDELAREHSLIKTLSDHNSRSLEERRAHRDAMEASLYSESKTDSKTSAFSASLDKPSSLAASKQSPGRMHQSISSPVGSSSSQKRVEVKMVQVKQINTNLSALRARQLAGRASPIEVGAFGSGRGSARSNGGGPGASLPHECVLTSLSQVLADCIPAASLVAPIREDEPLLQTFVRTLADDAARTQTKAPPPASRETLTDADLLGAFGALSERLDAIDLPVDPRKSWRATQLFVSMLEYVDEANDAFLACTEAFVRYAHMMVRQVDLHQDPSDRRALLDAFLDTALSRMTEMLKSAPRKRHACLTVIDAFAEHEPSTRRWLIKRLHEGLNDLGPFLQCLTILIFMEQSLSASGPGMALLDLYAYYALIGLSHATPSLRAASLAMFAVILQHDPSTADRLLPRMAQLVHDDWWEVQCQILIVSSKLLDSLVLALDDILAAASRPGSGAETVEGTVAFDADGGADTETVRPSTAEQMEESTADILQDQLDATVEIVCSVFSTQATLNVRKVGLVYLARHVQTHPHLARTVLEVLLDMSRNAIQQKQQQQQLLQQQQQQRQQQRSDGGLPWSSGSGSGADKDGLLHLLGHVPEAEELPLPSASGGRYHLPPIVSSWDARGLAQELARLVQETELENFEYWHLEILNALVQDAHRALDISRSSASISGTASATFRPAASEEKVRDEVEDDELESKHSSTEGDASFQRELFVQFKDLVFIALCDPVNYSLAIFITRTWALSSGLEVLETRSFSGALRLLFSQPPREHTWNGQQAMADLLLDLHTSGPRLAELVSSTVTALCTNYPELLENDILCDVEQRLEAP